MLFLSYASEDAARVEAFYDAFEAAGLDPWMDRRDIAPGAVWEDAVFEAIARCDQFIFFLSKNSASKRGFLQREVKRASLHWEEKLEGDLYVIPVRLDPSEMPRSLRRFQWFDAFDETRIPILIEFLSNKRSQSPAPTSRLRQTLDYRMKALEVDKPETCDLEVAVPQFFSRDDKPLSKINERLENITREIVTEFVQDLATPSEEESEDSADSPAIRDGLWIEPTVTTATQTLVSLELSVSTYNQGAAHPQHFTYTCLFDVEKAVELSLSDILKDEATALKFFSRYCSIALRTQWELTYLAMGDQVDLGDVQTWLGVFDEPDRDNFQNFIFRDHDLVFIFDPYHVGPYAFGRRTVELPFNDMYGLLTDRMVELLAGRSPG